MFFGRFDGVIEEVFYVGYNVVKKLSVICVEFDEVIYFMYVILRTELEMDLLSGKIIVYDLFKFWNVKMKEYLNVDIENDK